MPPLVMHIDMDAFFASVEQQINPALRGKPVIVGGRNNKYRSIIVAASYEAKALGISSAMPSWEALRICPQAHFVAADTAKYVYTSDQIFELLKKFSPQIEQFSIDEFFLDVSSCQNLLGSAEEIGWKIKKAIKRTFGITCTVGIAPTRITAKLAAKRGKPDGLVALDKRQLKEIFCHLPVEKICGIGNRLKKRFHFLGIETCGQLRDYPDRILQRHFGVVGLWLKQACRVENVDWIDSLETKAIPPKSVGHSQTLPEPSVNIEYIQSWIYLLSEMVAFRLRKKNLQGRTVSFYMAGGFEGGMAKRKTFQEATYDGLEIYERCLKMTREWMPRDWCARVLGVSVSGLVKAEATYLFERQNKREHLMRQIDHINRKYGDWTIYPALVRKAGGPR